MAWHNVLRPCDYCCCRCLTSAPPAAAAAAASSQGAHAGGGGGGVCGAHCRVLRHHHTNQAAAAGCEGPQLHGWVLANRKCVRVRVCAHACILQNRKAQIKTKRTRARGCDSTHIMMYSIAMAVASEGRACTPPCRRGGVRVHGVCGRHPHGRHLHHRHQRRDSDKGGCSRHAEVAP